MKRVLYNRKLKKGSDTPFYCWNGWTNRVHIIGSHTTPGKVYGCSECKICIQKKFIFVKFWKSTKKYYQIYELFCYCFILYNLEVDRVYIQPLAIQIQGDTQFLPGSSCMQVHLFTIIYILYFLYEEKMLSEVEMEDWRKAP